MTEFVANGVTAMLRPLPLMWARMLALSVFAGLLLTMSGAFDTEAAALLPRLAYWLLVVLLSTLALQGAHLALTRLGVRGSAVQVRAIGLFLLLLPLTAAASLGCKLLFGRPVSLAGYSHLLPGMTSILVSLQILIAFFSPAQAAIVARLATEGDLTALLPLHLRTGRIHAIEAEDHYIRVHASGGQALVRMRLRDAIECLSGEDGIQPHRSWWVARDSIRALRRSEGRARLTLVSGLEVPVSRKAAHALGPDFSR